ncbi:MAG: hypothetical protein ABIV26_02100, partial [Candidatus Limnocylindrales bacterium]
MTRPRPASPGSRWPARRLRRSALALLALAGMVAGGYAAARQAEFGDRTTAVVVADLMAGWSFIVAGAIAWDRRPGNRIGPLMLAVGLAWFVGSYSRLGNETTSHLARSFQGFHEPLLAWVVLAYPTGLLRSRAAHVVIGVWLVDQLGWSLARLILDRPLSWYGCMTCRETVDAYVANANALRDIGPLSLAITVALAIMVVLLLIRRWLAAGRAARRRLQPAMLAGLALGTSIAVTGAVRIGINPGLFGDKVVVAATYVLDMLTAVAVLVGLLQDRLARESVAGLIADLEAVPRGHPRQARDALARVLGDPTLRLLRPDGSGGYLDPDGVAEALPDRDATPRRAVTRLAGRPGEPDVAVLVHEPGLLDDPALAAAVAASIRLDAENR